MRAISSTQAMSSGVRGAGALEVADGVCVAVEAAGFSGVEGVNAGEVGAGGGAAFAQEFVVVDGEELAVADGAEGFEALEDQREALGGEAAGLLEDGFADADFAKVVEECGVAQFGEFVGAEGESSEGAEGGAVVVDGAGKQEGVVGDALGVASGGGVAGVNGGDGCLNEGLEHLVDVAGEFRALHGEGGGGGEEGEEVEVFGSEHAGAAAAIDLHDAHELVLADEGGGQTGGDLGEHDGVAGVGGGGGVADVHDGFAAPDDVAQEGLAEHGLHRLPGAGAGEEGDHDGGGVVGVLDADGEEVGEGEHLEGGLDDAFEDVFDFVEAVEFAGEAEDDLELVGVFGEAVGEGFGALDGAAGDAGHGGGAAVAGDGGWEGDFGGGAAAGRGEARGGGELDAFNG